MGRPRSELVLRDDPPAPGVAPPRWEREEAFGVLFRKHAEGLIRLAYCLLGARVEDMTDVIGTWLLEGTGTTLVVVRTSPGVLKYVVDDDGDGLVSPDQWGRVTLRPEGGIVLRPEGGTQGITWRPEDGTHEVCETVYTRAITTGATLETEVDATSCDRFGVRRDTWIRLN